METLTEGEIAQIARQQGHSVTPVHRHEFARFLAGACVARRKLFQAAVGGAADVSATRLHLEVQLPPTPCPLAEGTEWEHQRHQDELTPASRQKEKAKCPSGRGR